MLRCNKTGWGAARRKKRRWAGGSSPHTPSRSVLGAKIGGIRGGIEARKQAIKPEGRCTEYIIGPDGPTGTKIQGFSGTTRVQWTL
jgi:hypothetical protein